MAKALLWCVLLFAALGRALPSSRGEMRVWEKRERAPRNFASSGATPADHVISLRLGLAQSNFSGLEHALYDVSTPGRPQYGQHLSKAEVAEFIRPSSETVSAVSDWLASHGLTAMPLSPAGDWLAVNVTVDQANSILDAQYTNFTHVDTGRQAIRTLSYSLPAVLDGHVTFVHPTTAFPRSTVRHDVLYPRSFSAAAEKKATDTSSCASAITPACLQAMYNIPSTPAMQPSNKLAVSGFVEQYANEADLQMFLATYRPDLPASTNFTVQTINGGQNPQSQAQAGSEADLDVQYTLGVASGVPTVFISVGTAVDEVDGFMDLTNMLAAAENPPSVVTTSYGYGENDFPFSMATALCSAYAQLGARGISVLFASGDEGVCGDQGTSCSNFGATFPSSCPYVTAVGATTGAFPESGASLSGGGFSSWFARPLYQSAAVDSYVDGLGTQYTGKYNATGRAFPDVASAGEQIQMVYRGALAATAGTSASSPIFASVVALLNDELVAAGKAPLGFLNPWLYANPGAFNDITTGNNPGCFTNGFSAKEGWDPVTGLGTPNYTKLRTAAGL